MNRYKNKTKEVIKFRAHDSKGIVQRFELKPGEEMESDRKVENIGLEKAGKGKSEKKETGDE